MGWYLIAGTVPIAIIGFAFSDLIETKTRDLYLIGTTLIALGLVLLAAEKMSKHERKLESTTMRDAIAIGFGQAAALIPGVSRSGSTITGRSRAGSLASSDTCASRAGPSTTWIDCRTMSATSDLSSSSACSKVEMPPDMTTGVSHPAARTASRTSRVATRFRPNGPRSSDRTVGMHS